MKTTLLLLAVALVAPLAAADASKIMLSGTSVSVEEGRVSGAARAIVGDLTISADAIVFDRTKNVLRCEGAVQLRVSGNVVTARDCLIELPAGEKKLFVLSQGNISIGPRAEVNYAPLAPNDLVGTRADRDKVIQDFNARVNAAPPASLTPARAP